MTSLTHNFAVNPHWWFYG